MAMANIAVVLAKWGRKVLIVDWDLEAPGLEYFFYDRVKDQSTLDLIRKKKGDGSAHLAPAVALALFVLSEPMILSMKRRPRDFE